VLLLAATKAESWPISPQKGPRAFFHPTEKKVLFTGVGRDGVLGGRGKVKNGSPCFVGGTGSGE